MGRRTRRRGAVQGARGRVLRLPGGDPTDYEEAFKQVNAEGAYDLQPVMDLLEFVGEADDEEFARELEEHLDTESFARYLALQELMSNGDGMDGPGNNYYLWYDTRDARFTVLSWDLNLSFGGMGGAPGGTGEPEGETPPGGTEAPEGVGAPEGGAAPEGAQTPGGAAPPGDADMPGGTGETGADGMPGGAGAGGSGALKDRFLDNEGFRQMYEEAYSELHASLVADGTASELLESAVARAGAAGDTGAAGAGEALAERIAAIADAPGEDGSPGGEGRPPVEPVPGALRPGAPRPTGGLLPREHGAAVAQLLADGEGAAPFARAAPFAKPRPPGSPPRVPSTARTAVPAVLSPGAGPRRRPNPGPGRTPPSGSRRGPRRRPR
ncbi:CotH kinase family protein [Nocardiopsis sp. ARC36]